MALAVDGGGLPLSDGTAGVFFSVVALLVFVVVRKVLRAAPVPLRNWGAVLVAAIPLYPLMPIAHRLLSFGYAERLCSSDSGAWQRVTLAEWNVPGEPFRSRPTNRTTTDLPSGYREATFVAGLAEQWKGDGRALGVTQVHRRLQDSSTGVTLMEATYFNDERGRTPPACHRTNIFWVWRNQYIEKAKRAIAEGGAA